MIDGRRYAVELSRVERVLRMVASTPLAKAPAIVVGVFDYAGELVPVLNVRRRFGLPERAPALADQLLLMHTARRLVAFAVDAVEPVCVVAAEQVAPAEGVVPGLEHVRGIARLPDGLVLVHDLETFLALDEERQLTAALAPAPA